MVAAVLAQRDRFVAAGHDAGPETIRWDLQQSMTAPTVPSRASHHPRRAPKRCSSNSVTNTTPSAPTVHSTDARQPQPRHDGQLHSIGIGRRLDVITVKALVNGLNATIIDAIAGEVLRQLTLDTARKYQPQTQETPNPEGSRPCRCPETSHCRADRI